MEINYESLFGALDFKKGEEARSVYSPAAYLADLLQLLDDYFDNPEIDERRPDIKTLDLDGTQTFSLLSYLEIVNELLQKRGDGTSFELLKNKPYPLNLPFNLDQEKVKQMLSYSNIKLEDIYKLFSLSPNASEIARISLGLNSEMERLLLQGDAAPLLDIYGVKNREDIKTPVAVEFFMTQMEINGRQIRSLLNANLHPAEKDFTDQLFTNYGLNGYAKLDDNEEHIIWHSLTETPPSSEGSEEGSDLETTNIPDTWLIRANHIIRLSKATGIELNDLDLMLRSCCEHQLNEKALQRIAVINALGQKYDLPIDEVCSFFAPMNTLGNGDKKMALDCFNRIYNNEASVDGKYFSVSESVPDQLKQIDTSKPIIWTADLTGTQNLYARKRIAKALQISDKELQLIIDRFVEPFIQFMDIQLEESLPYQTALLELSLFHRIVKCARLLDLSIAEYLQILDMIQGDATIRQMSNFNSLLPVSNSVSGHETLDINLILINGNLEETFWLIPQVAAVAEWLLSTPMTTSDLSEILRSGSSESKEGKLMEAKKITGFNNLFQQLSPSFLQAAQFASERFGKRGARIIYDELTSDNSAVVVRAAGEGQGSANHNILKGDQEQLAAAAEAIISQFQVIKAKDFMGLGIEEKMQQKIFNNLIIKGFIKPDGTIIKDKIPQNIEDFSINNSSLTENETLFNVIHELYEHEAKQHENDLPSAKLGNGSSTSSQGNFKLEDFVLYQSDLDTLPVEDTRKKELYDNLIFNGYIDPEGTVLNPGFFADDNNLYQFDANAHIASYSPPVYQLIQSKLTAYEQDALILDTSTFEGLGLKEIEVIDLLENLKFNEYLGHQNALIDKPTIATLEIADFKLALPFYPYRRQILDRIQISITNFKSSYFKLKESELNTVAQEIVADLIFQNLAETHLTDDRFSATSIAFFAEESNVQYFQLGKYFDDNTQLIVFKAVRKIIEQFFPYQIHHSQFWEEGFEEEDTSQIISDLKSQQLLQKDNTLTKEQVDFFLNINNALVLNIPDFEDYNKDIFFIVHELAKTTEAAISEISDTSKTIAEHQKSLLLNGLQELLEMPSDWIDVVAQQIFPKQQSIVETFIPPLLSALDQDEQISSLPFSPTFNRAYDRMLQFSKLSSLLGLDATEAAIIFRDQDLTQKFPESLSLEDGMDRFHFIVKLSLTPSIFENLDLEKTTEVLMLYYAPDQLCLFYDSQTYALLGSTNQLKKLIPDLKDQTVNAAFNDPQGNTWMIAGTDFFFCAAGTTIWEKKEKNFGHINNNFFNIDHIDASFVDAEGKIYLFAGDQYLRCTHSIEQTDPGYPKKIKDNWTKELGFRLPDAYLNDIDAAFQDRNGLFHFFKGENFISSDNINQEKSIKAHWATVQNNLAKTGKLDATLTLGDKVYLFSGDQVMTWSSGLEHADGHADEGSIQSLKSLIPSLPEVFEDGIDSIFRGFDDQLHIFRKQHYLRCTLDFMVEETSTAKLTDIWAKVHNPIKNGNPISAAFSGLDGRAYLFSGNQFYRYSGQHFDVVDEGYPKKIISHWGGLKEVDAAFILDGKTYLFGKNSNDEMIHVRYSTNDYSQHDEGYPQDAKDAWWSEHFNLKYTDFNQPDTVFWDDDGSTYLFKSGQYITYNHLRRWWSEPAPIKDNWKDLDLEIIDAAFTAKNGKTYFFSEDKVYRYSDPNFMQLDDRYPKAIVDHWGKVKNNIANNKRIDASLVLSVAETKETAWEMTTVHHQLTFLFSGNQYVRYSGGNYQFIDEGYPKRINQSLKDEPGFGNLVHHFPEGIDAAFADQRNIYLFSGSDVHVISTVLSKVYSNKLSSPITNLFQEKGKLFIENEEGWQLLQQVEDEAKTNYVASPMLKYDAPALFLQQLNASFLGTDGNLYLFKDGQCYNDHLEKAYPIHEEWGKAKNNIQEHERVDAGFLGQDGKVYLFSGDQFYTYPAGGSRPLYTYPLDNLPQPISEHWGGLQNVQLAFVKEEKTYLFEAPDENGQFRYICYDGEKYDNPESHPQTADISWWGFPSAYLDDGFTEVKAVIFEEGNMYLLSDHLFIQFNQSEQVWNYPRPIDRIWRNFPLSGEEPDQKLVSAFKTDNNNTYFFTHKRFFGYQEDSRVFSSQMNIKNGWGKINNNISIQNKVDAALVLDGTTYLFSGNQYVRYSTKDYRVIDHGYPKAITTSLRSEKSFENLPDTFESTLETIFREGGRISGAAADERTIYLFADTNIIVTSKAGHGNFEVQRLSRLENNIKTSGQIDAAFVDMEGRTFLFSGDQYIRYSNMDYDLVDEGYPKSIRHFLQQFNLELSLADFSLNLDAALQDKQGQVCLFKGKSIFHPAWAEVIAPLSEKLSIEEQSFSLPVDAAFMDQTGNTYFFKGNEYIKYSDFSQEFIDEGYPKPIKSNWGKTPESFIEGIDGAFVFEGRTYLCKKDEHLRYSSTNYNRIDAIYPQKFNYRWTNWNDYLLDDLRLITAFKDLNNKSETDEKLSDLLDLDKGYIKTPYQMLSDLFDWDIEQIKWIKQHNAFLKAGNGMEVHFNLELILQMQSIFKMAEQMGTTPKALYESIWWTAFDQNNWSSTADQLYSNLALNHSEVDWTQISKELKDKFNTIKHQALLPYVIAIDDTIEDARDLFANMLIDVEMGSEAQTSRIKEAIAALQLYVHRFFTNLEPGKLKETEVAPDVQLEKLKSWWKWMKNYRVWEANRKVFLYPENYIRPELRDTKTPEFKKLEETLLSGNIDQENVTKAYNEYLNQFATIGNLKISGANVYDDPEKPETKILILFGYTKTDPQEYYYRTAKFLSNGKILWNNWEKISITMKSSRVFPVYAFGRVMVFWTEIEDYEESNATIVNNKSTSTVNNKDKILKHRADIKYSFTDFNNKWINPQTLKKDVELDYKIEAAFSQDGKIYAFSGKYCMVSSEENPEGEVQEIKQVFSGINEYFHNGIDAVAIYNGDRFWFKGNLVALNNEKPRPIKWHFDNKEQDMFAHFGINFPFDIKFRPQPQFHPPEDYQDGVAAAFVQDGIFCLIDLKGGFTFFRKEKNAERNSGSQMPTFESKQDIVDVSINSFWFAFLKVITNNFLKLEPVDAIFKDKNNVLYFLTNGMYNCYIYNSAKKDNNKKLEKVEGFPKPIRGNLSFNMDKFFNKLHVVPYTNNSGEFINLSYVTPKEGSLLLNGQISADFKFKEGNLRKDFKLYRALKEEFTLTAKTLPYDKELNAQVQGTITTSKRFITTSSTITNLEILESNLGIIKSEAAKITKIHDDNINLAANKRSMDSSVKAAIDLALSNANSAISAISDRNRAEWINTLDSEIEALKTALDLYAGNKKKKNLEDLKEANDKMLAHLTTLDTSNDLNKLKTQVESTKVNITNEARAYLGQHLRIYQSYKAFLDFLDRSIKESEDIGKKVVNFFRGRSTKVDQATESYKTIKKQYEPLINKYATAIKIFDNGWSPSRHNYDNPLSLTNVKSSINKLSGNMDSLSVNFNSLDKAAQALENKRGTTELNDLHELYFGKFDLFPRSFEIQNDTNFTFSEPDWYVFEAKKGTFLCRPIEVEIPIHEASEEGESAPIIRKETKYEIVRLTTTTIPEISNRLFTGGISKLLSMDTQLLSEFPFFEPATQRVTARDLASVERRKAETITYNRNEIVAHPVATTLDYRGANGNYYWEMFFHAPFLIAQSLNTAQKFEEAKEWYEYIFDPTNKTATWQFIPLQKGMLKNVPEPADLQEYITQKIDIDDLEQEMEVYLNDPFDPHAIARLREIAYKKAIVMRYIDNLLDWGDMLFGQYTMESINEARMLYIHAYDLLGKKPESLGKKVLSTTKKYQDLQDETADANDLLLKPTVISVARDTPHESVTSPYFFIPSNTLFHDYWNRVEDRLFKIRNSLNIDGIKQALPLFQPPIDPMSIVQAVGSGASLAQALGSINASVPHYRFSFMVQKAKELVGKLNQFSGELLSALEKKDAEEVALLQNKQEAKIRSMMTNIKEAQLAEANESINALQASLDLVRANKKYNEETYKDDYLPLEILQLTTMGVAVGAHTASVILKVLAAITAPVPQVKVGIDAGPEAGGKQISEPLSQAAESIQSAAEGISILGEMFGIGAQHQRMMADTKHAADTAIYDIQQIESQLIGADIQIKIAEYELAIHEKELEHQASINTFMQNKFSNKALYQWMTGKLSAVYYQTYKLALDMAKSAEKAFQFEKGLPAQKVNFIQGMYWDSQRKGLLAGDQLGLDLERMEEAYLKADQRRLEITKSISLLDLNPQAFLDLKSKGVCEFEFDEAFFDYDFPGHYNRQVKTISIRFDSPQTVNATLTQLSNKMVMSPDKKAVKFLLDPKDQPPTSIRSNWRAAQQIALSHIEEYEEGNGLFELRFDDDRYLPFEGTGAISRWRLELNGKRGSIKMEDLANLTIKLKYTAINGGELFKDTVKGMLKPYFTTQYLSLADDFYDTWENWLGNGESELSLPMTQDRFPNMASSKITGIFSKFETKEDSNQSFILNGDEALTLKSDRFLVTGGLSVSSRGSEWILTHKGDKSSLKNVLLVIGYKAKV